jgi:transmembrane sensor
MGAAVSEPAKSSTSGSAARVRDGIIEQATDWYLRHRDGDLSTSEQQEFLAWLRASMQHTHEYLAIARLSGSLPEAMADLGLEQAELLERAGQQVGPVPIGQMSTRRPRRALWIGVAAACLATVCAYWLTAPGFAGLPRAISVAHGEQRTVQLDDGSVVHINASSRLVVRFSHSQRLVELDRGQAMFEVAHQASRPFRVVAGAVEVTAIGTEFDVYRRNSTEVAVTVVQGKVDVVGVPTAPSGHLELGAGAQVRIASPAQHVEPKQVDIREATAWVRREIMFDGQSLREVTREFNRYIPKPIEIDDAALNDLQVSGVFNAYDSDSFLVFLRQYDVEVTEGPETIHVRRR